MHALYLFIGDRETVKPFFSIWMEEMHHFEYISMDRFTDNDNIATKVILIVELFLVFGSVNTAVL